MFEIHLGVPEMEELWKSLQKRHQDGTATKEEDVLLSFGNWMLTEGLAEYYLRKTDSNSRSFQSCQEQAEVYRQLESTCGTDAVMLYRAALKR